MTDHESIENRAARRPAIPHETADAGLSRLRVDLINAQSDLEEIPRSVLILVMGNDRLACDHLIDRLHEWMDARYLLTEIFLARTEWEEQHPRFWRYWAVLPPHGRIGIFAGGWPLATVTERVRGEMGKSAFARRLAHCRNFEKALSDNGTLLLKFWLHASHKKLSKHLKRSRKSMLVETIDNLADERYDDTLKVANEVVAGTDTATLPWRVYATEDRKSCEFSVACEIRDAIVETATAHREPRRPAPVIEVDSAEEIPSALGKVDLTARLERGEYVQQLKEAQTKLVRWQRRARRAGITTVLAMEGWDAGGKGGVIRRMIRPLPSRDYRVIPIAAPTDEEKAQHYLWRFWRRLPRSGRMVIFDRSWYGRVLVERVEGFASHAEWRRAYGEINDFESQLVEHGIPVVKFWLHLSPEEQLRRFEAREETPFKKYKITAEDYRNREKWDAYAEAVDEMVHRTSTKAAPWHLVSSEDKRWARVRVIRTVYRALKAAVNG